MGVSLEEPNAKASTGAPDITFARDGYDVVIEKSILDKVGQVRIHFRPNPYIGAEMLVTPA